MAYSSAFQKIRSARIDTSVFVATVALNLLAVGTPLAVLMIFERVIPHQSFATLQVLGIGMVLVAVLEFLLRRARASLLIFAAGRNATAHQMSFLSRILKANPSAVAQDDPEVHLERQSAIDQLRDQEAGEGKTLAIDLPFSFVFVALIGLIGGWLILVPLTCLGLVIGFAWVLKRAQRRIFDQRRALDRRRYAFLSEAFSRITDIKANTMERQMSRRFEMLQSKTAESSSSLIRFSGLSQSFGAAIGQMSIAAVGLFGAYLVMGEFIGLAELAACMLLNGRVVQPFTRLLTIWVQGEAAAAARKKLHEIDVLQSDFRDGASDKMRGTLDCTDVKLADRTAQLPATEAFSVGLEAGQTLVVDADKDQFIHLLFDTLLGHVVPAQGRIYIDGRLPAVRMSQRGSAGLLVLEDVPAILTGTLIENLSAFGSGEHIERARRLSSQLGLERRVRRLPEGYDTPLNSGGYFERDAVNRQLIALVRALALQPKMLLMHEPSAILDVEERDALQRCLASLPNRPTMLLASPDPRLRGFADKTLFLKTSEAGHLAGWDSDLELEQSLQLSGKGAV